MDQCEEPRTSFYSNVYCSTQATHNYRTLRYHTGDARFYCGWCPTQRHATPRDYPLFSRLPGRPWARTPCRSWAGIGGTGNNAHNVQRHGTRSMARFPRYIGRVDKLGRSWRTARWPSCDGPSWPLRCWPGTVAPRRSGSSIVVGWLRRVLGWGFRSAPGRARLVPSRGRDRRERLGGAPCRRPASPG